MYRWRARMRCSGTMSMPSTGLQRALLDGLREQVGLDGCSRSFQEGGGAKLAAALQSKGETGSAAAPQCGPLKLGTR